PCVLLGAALARRVTARRLRQAFGVLILLTALRILIAVPEHTGLRQPWPPALNIALGCVVGILGGLLGVGGGTILVPVLVLGQGYPQHVAQGVSLLMILPTGIVGAWSHARHGHMLRAILPGLMAGGAMGGLLGALLAHRIESSMLSRLFAIFLLPVSAQMIFGRGRDNVADSPERSGG
ncbi:MAG TPA: sulfite exporter TauE/SafE family protein, partial [Candidatus Limnocylindrales bacterium]|nr:sulfite exporter TauE/SafE family protein [Candidatus Limnocylindrales bacterium]